MMSDSRNVNISQYRYPGVKPFTSEEKDIFFGRKKDIENLYDLIQIKQMMVLYGKSGYGKSSLLNAGIIPKIHEENKWLNFTIRFNNYSERQNKDNISPVTTITTRLSQNLSTEPSFLDKLIPNENSFWYWIKNNQRASGKSKFIIIFDQFEELFTYPKSQIDEFSEQLAQVLYPTIPVQFRKRIDELDEKQEIDDDLYDFLYDKFEIKVIFSVRSDRLSLLNALTDRHPGILQNYYELNPLSKDQAEEAIIGPAELPKELGFTTDTFTFSKAALEKIIHHISNTADGKIENSTLQIVCRYVEEELVSKDLDKIINDDELGNISDIFKRYYEKILSNLNSHERLLSQRLIEDELIESGKRNLLLDDYIKNKFKLSQSLLHKLEQSSLLRKELDASGRLLYEVSHDSLVSAIENVAQGRRKIEEEETRLNLEKQIEEERNKANELRKAKEVAENRLFFARIMSGVAIVAMLVAFYFLYKATKSEEKALVSEAVAKNANITILREQTLATAKEMVNFGDRYFGMQNLNTACDRYKKALNILHDYKNEQLYREVEQKIIKTCGK